MNLVIRALPGSVLRLKDIVAVELVAKNYAMLSQTNRHPGANAMIAQTAGSNTYEVIIEIDRTLDGYNDFSNLYTIHIFLTTNMTASADIDTELYRNRWGCDCSSNGSSSICVARSAGEDHIILFASKSIVP